MEIEHNCLPWMEQSFIALIQIRKSEFPIGQGFQTRHIDSLRLYRLDEYPLAATGLEQSMPLSQSHYQVSISGQIESQGKNVISYEDKPKVNLGN